MRKNTDKYTQCTNCAQLVQQATVLTLSGGASSVAMAFRDGTCAWACFCQSNSEKGERWPPHTRCWGSRFQLLLPETPRTGASFRLLTQSNCRALFFLPAWRCNDICEHLWGKTRMGTSVWQTGKLRRRAIAWLLGLVRRGCDTAGDRFLISIFQHHNHKDNLFSLAAWNQI